MIKFVHAADLHIDSPMRGLCAYEGAPTDRVRTATRDAFRNLIGLCLEERAAFLLLAGDVFDGDWKDFNTGLFFVRELQRLRDAGVRVFVVRGNHDAASEVTQKLTLPEHVHEFSDERAETVVLEEHGVALHGLSFGRRAMPDTLVPLYPKAVKGALNIGVMHTSADGRPGHSTYAPCRVDELAKKGYAYWALGHVHTHEVLAREPWVVFPGNLQGRHVKETGAKGCVVVTADGGEVRSVEHRALDVVRWEHLQVALDESDDVDVLYEKSRAALADARAAADGRMVAARLTVTGASRAHDAVLDKRTAVISELRALTFDWGDDVWLEDVRLHTRPPLQLEALRASPGFVGELLRDVAGAAGDEGVKAALEAALAPLREKLGDEVQLDMRELLGDVEALLAARLTQVRR